MISAIVPARNEEMNIARALESLDGQAEVREIIVVNDGSTDRTGEVLAELQVRVPKLRVTDIRELPAGWVGKNYAAAMGARAATCEWLLFVDADTELYPGAAWQALADAEEHAASLVSYSPEQVMETLAEEILIPFVYSRLAERFSYERVNDPGSQEAAANGQLLLVRRDAYDAIGGHEAVRARVLEDVALARLVKASGRNIFFGPGQGIVRTRMYRTIAAMWQGWTKNLYELMGGTLGAFAREIIETFPWLEIALLICGLIETGRSRWILIAAAAIVLAGSHLRYARALRRNRYPLSLIQFYVPASLLYAVVLAASYWKHVRGAVAWKGRRYPTGTR
ncbi:MAG TPA: glycosyltransferase [Candidatus Acidoferrales bacterium]|nr:glycosyltransferase [Candidatus Acidoferrales bacterium]